MKKNMLYKVMMMVLMAVVTMTFAACGGDDAGDNTNNGNSGGGTTSTGIEYVMPNLSWGSKPEYIKSTMNWTDYELIQEESYHGVTITLRYYNAKKNIMIVYVFNGSEKLITAETSFAYVTRNDLSTIVEQVEKAYGVTFGQPSIRGEMVFLSTRTTINSEPCFIQISDMTAVSVGNDPFISVYVSLEEPTLN